MVGFPRVEVPAQKEGQKVAIFLSLLSPWTSGCPITTKGGVCNMSVFGGIAAILMGAAVVVGGVSEIVDDNDNSQDQSSSSGDDKD
jgi:hypothetical protein